VRDRVLELIGQRAGLIESVIRAAVVSGHLPPSTDVSQMCFEILALATGANLMFQLTKYSGPKVR